MKKVFNISSVILTLLLITFICFDVYCSFYGSSLFEYSLLPLSGNFTSNSITIKDLNGKNYTLFSKRVEGNRFVFYDSNTKTNTSIPTDTLIGYAFKRNTYIIQTKDTFETYFVCFTCNKDNQQEYIQVSNDIISKDFYWIYVNKNVKRVQKINDLIIPPLILLITIIYIFVLFIYLYDRYLKDICDIVNYPYSIIVYIPIILWAVSCLYSYIINYIHFIIAVI